MKTDLNSQRVFTYSRASTTSQAGHSLDATAQSAQLERWAEQHDCIVVKAFIEPASACRDDRAELQAMIAAATSDERPADAILVQSPSRLFRNALKFAVDRARLAAHGVEIISTTQEFEPRLRKEEA
jgi:DNA invertase Pin-like site-specific DNA recombinase